MHQTAATALSFLLVVITLVPAGRMQSRKKLLFLTHTGLYKHTSLGPAERAVTELGKSAGFEVTALEGYKQESEKLDLSFLTSEYLSQFDGLMMMTNGNLPLDDKQKKALVDFVRNGKGFVGVHCASLTFYNYPEFGEMLGGYYRRSIRQNRVFVLKVEDRTHPSTRMLGDNWTLTDEFYIFGEAAWNESRPAENVDVLFGNRIPMGFSRERVRVLLSLDTEKSELSNLQEVKRGGDYPQAWCRQFGKGRSFYTSLGHRDDIWSDSVFRKHITGGIRWALGLEQ